MITQSVLKVILAGGFLSCGFLVAQNQDFDSLGHPIWLSTAKVQTDASADTVDRPTRLARATHFNSPAGMGHPLDDPTVSSNQQVRGGSHDFSQPDSMPTAYSDAIVTGTATDFQPFLSADRTMIYSELSFTPETILKDDSHEIKPKATFTLLQEGGTLQLPGGRTAVSMPYGGANPLRIHVRYLLFLTYLPQSKSYTVERAWDISNSHPRELDNDGHPYQSKARAESNNTNDEASLLSLVKARINQK